jgi:hypothetical protein
MILLLPEQLSSFGEIPIFWVMATLSASMPSR